MIHLEEYRARIKSDRAPQSRQGELERARALLSAAQSPPPDELRQLREQVSELTRTMVLQMADHGRIVRDLRAQLAAVSAQKDLPPATLNAQEWNALEDILRNPPKVPDWLRKAVLDE